MNMRHLSKTIAHALRHAPQEYGLTLDPAGWTPLDSLLQSLQQQPTWQDLTEADIHEMLRQADKKRYEIDNGRIRAFYGHSLAQKIEKMPAIPPPVLYHGTTPAVVPTILQEGLKPMSRQYVHLSVDIETAHKVGRRRTATPIILKVNAQQAHAAGISFYASHDEIWLAEAIPGRYLSLLT